jgi:hypothetical protein
MQSTIRVLLASVVLIVSLGMLPGCGGSPTSAPGGGAADKEAIMRKQKEMQEKMQGKQPRPAE